MTLRPNTTKLTIFLAVCAFIATYVAVFLGDLSLGEGHDDYSAVFEDASGLEPGSPVRIAGVEVGSVTAVSIHRGSQALVRFRVEDGLQLTSTTQLLVRYKNLIGDRYLELSRSGSSGATLSPSTTIPASRTAAAIDLDTLLNGFQPLFQGLDAKQINQLSIDLVRTLQGESGTIQSVLANVASLSGELADRDQVVGDVIDNLRVFLGVVSKRGNDLDDLIVNLQALISGLDDERALIGRTVEHVADLGDSTATLLADARPDLKSDVRSLRTVTTTLAQNQGVLAMVLAKLPDTYARLARYGSYGSFFNFYVCALRFKIDGPTGPMYTPYQRNKADRCQG